LSFYAGNPARRGKISFGLHRNIGGAIVRVAARRSTPFDRHRTTDYHFRLAAPSRFPRLNGTETEQVEKR
jgi:hypothetical protein